MAAQVDQQRGERGMGAAVDDVVQKFDQGALARRAWAGKFHCALHRRPGRVPSTPRGMDEPLHGVGQRELRVVAGRFQRCFQGAWPGAGMEVDRLV